MDYKEYQAKVKELQKTAREMKGYIFHERVEIASRLNAKYYTYEEFSKYGQLMRAECAIKAIENLLYEL